VIYRFKNTFKVVPKAVLPCARKQVMSVTALYDNDFNKILYNNAHKCFNGLLPLYFLLSTYDKDVQQCCIRLLVFILPEDDLRQQSKHAEVYSVLKMSNLLVINLLRIYV
jgi:hypothetical protein